MARDSCGLTTSESKKFKRQCGRLCFLKIAATLSPYSATIVSNATFYQKKLGVLIGSACLMPRVQFPQP